MQTVIGIDAATQASHVGLARGVSKRGVLEIEEAHTPGSNQEAVDTVAGWCRGPTLIAIDAPLGWPSAMGGALASHRAGDGLGAGAHDLFRRRTDDRVHAVFRKRPLDVGSNLIARTAHAALALLAGVRETTGEAIPLAWSPGEAARVRAIEVYPAATLRARGLPDGGYKGKDRARAAARTKLLDALSSEVRCDGFVRAAATRTDHVLDAILCVLAGGDFLAGDAIGPGEADADRARHEGWIWVRAPKRS